MDELFNLDYEDIVGGIPTRFKYREVPANDFGLTPEEILLADDKELNAWVSLRKAVQYRSSDEEHRDRKRFKQRSKDAVGIGGGRSRREVREGREKDFSHSNSPCS